MNPYKCTEHHLELACPGCIKAWISRHDEMKIFIHSISLPYLSLKEIESLAERRDDIALIAINARELLKEIGEL